MTETSANSFSFYYLFEQIYNFLFGLSPIEEKTRRILCTGKWRQFDNRRQELEFLLKNPVTALTQLEEGQFQAKCGHSILFNEGLLPPISDNADDCYLYLGAGRGSTQFTILDFDGNVVNAYNVETGYPKGGSPDIELLRNTATRLHENYGSRIKMVLGFDSIFHVLKKNSPVVEDETPLPSEVLTTGSDFLELGYLTDLYANTPMLVVRNFILKDGTMRKITFATGEDLLIDLGSGNANLVDPITGTHVMTVELPGDWMTNDESLAKVAIGMEKLLDEAIRIEEEYDINESSEEEDDT